MAYVQFLRFERFAWSWMRAGETRTLTDLAADAGFGDYATFSRRMRGLLGKPPSRILAASSG